MQGKSAKNASCFHQVAILFSSDFFHQQYRQSQRIGTSNSETCNSIEACHSCAAKRRVVVDKRRATYGPVRVGFKPSSGGWLMIIACNLDEDFWLKLFVVSKLNNINIHKNPQWTWKQVINKLFGRADVRRLPIRYPLLKWPHDPSPQYAQKHLWFMSKYSCLAWMKKDDQTK